MACATCYKDYISCGEAAIYVNGSLIPETNYTWIITSPSGATYSGLVTTDADGHFVIDTSTIPDMMLNPYAGIFVLTVQINGCDKSSWNDSAYCDKYDCIEFEAKNGNEGKNTLGCPCLEDIEGCCSPTIIAFDDLEDLDIVYTSDMRNKYGDVPTVQVWIYDNTNRLVNILVSVAFDAVPATLISIDFGGESTGVVVIR